MSAINRTSVVSSTLRVGRDDRVRPAADPAQLIALREGVYRAPDEVRTLRVLAGCAWVSLGSIDHILMPGEQLAIPRGAGSAVVSALGDNTLIVEAGTGKVL
ncbi:MAG: hypothetical protein IT323_11145 [Anaerolineae bacterium]|nr:hypothetical protein [Anaerolineae bacterium]